jgi:ABC-type uncharacterized transport system permease subunit
MPRILSWVFSVVLVLQADDHGRGNEVSLLWIILIVILVLALLGFFTRGRW